MSRRVTEQKILDAAESLIQTRGYNTFSFHDVSKQVGVTTASVHHYFPTKGDLGHALLVDHRRAIRQTLARIDDQLSEPWRRIERYINLYQRRLGDGSRLSLCVILSAEYNTLPAPMQDELKALLQDADAWLARTLGRGQTEGHFQLAGTPESTARSISAALQGAMLSARAFGDVHRVAATGRWLLKSLGEAQGAELLSPDPR